MEEKLNRKLRFTEKWFHGIMVSEKNVYCEIIFAIRGEMEWEAI